MIENKHKFYMVQILKDIYADISLSPLLGFKGGTALMFFYDLPRFSVDLDFNLLDVTQEKFCYDKLRKILLKYGKIDYEAMKFYGIILVLDYGVGERKLKIEVSNRQYDNHYEIKDLLGINILTLKEKDMFAHKLCALFDRSSIINRDIFDNWFFMSRHTPVNEQIVYERTGKRLSDYLAECIKVIEELPNKNFLDVLGELTDAKMKTFVRNKLRSEFLSLLRFYQAFPII
ncbi:MAG: nucleotidyl transferase AbiEii/AbiGii toxin family protein [Bacteroidales bacterium]|jgi:predicted nucleotidyltransferase component of viral defense system|nr:nucleotidyl transferase AbiEii/AbiGii toxin family protein [Bacteroidales bacterium]MDD2204788.1 nucleotidyl transferase AbiEii/AbiGii toxin family protein [Bacteroidales bacterium]MDD3914029.1 nucleotidyl transferase AbiEii/AbiGii toxin family protein [Bacteroidales bacterium]MDD4633879.1 nucleotidyl transferase AbiEii/AbiGii toxin family protein [Bacteroidales bacterium]